MEAPTEVEPAFSGDSPCYADIVFYHSRGVDGKDPPANYFRRAYISGASFTKRQIRLRRPLKGYFKGRQPCAKTARRSSCGAEGISATHFYFFPVASGCLLSSAWFPIAASLRLLSAAQATLRPPRWAADRNRERGKDWRLNRVAADREPAAECRRSPGRQAEIGGGRRKHET